MASQLALMLVRSTGNYVLSKMDTSTGSFIYRKTMLRCIDILSQSNDLDISESLILDFKSSGNHLYPNKFFRSNKEIIYHNLGCDQVLDIIHSIRTRFVVGGSNSYKSLKERWLYEDKSVF